MNAGPVPADPVNSGPLARTVVPLTASGQYTGSTESIPPSARPSGRRGVTVRAKLTMIYGALFIIAGAILVTVVYFFVQWRLNHMKAGLPSWCTLTPADKAAGRLKLTAVQSAICARYERADTLHQILVASLTALGVSAVVAIAVGYWIAGRVLRPIRRVTATARRIALRPDVAARTRISLDGPPDELRELADTFDEMLDRLDLAFQSQRRFTGNASHELRTPLAINRTLLEVALSDPEVPPQTEQLAKALLATNERSERMIEGLLSLARADNAVVDPVPVDLASVAARCAAQCEAEAAEHSVQLRTSFGRVAVFGDGALLERVATNLVQNGIRYNQPGGWVDVVTYDQGSYGLLVIANSGPQVPEHVVESLFEPFRRLEQPDGPSRPRDRGAGLGLSIVRAIVAAHQGRIAVQPRTAGGLIVRVWLPVP